MGSNAPRPLHYSFRSPYGSDLQSLSTEIEDAVSIFLSAEEMNRLALDDPAYFKHLIASHYSGEGIALRARLRFS